MFNLLMFFLGLLIFVVVLYLKQFVVPIWKFITYRSPSASERLELKIYNLEQEYLQRRMSKFIRLLDDNPTLKYNNGPVRKKYTRNRKSVYS